MRRRPRSTLFPYTTLFRSVIGDVLPVDRARAQRDAPERDQLLEAVGGELARVGSGHLVHARQSRRDRKSTRLNSSHLGISYAVFCLKKKKRKTAIDTKQSI